MPLHERREARQELAFLRDERSDRGAVARPPDGRLPARPGPERGRADRGRPLLRLPDDASGVVPRPLNDLVGRALRPRRRPSRDDRAQASLRTIAEALRLVEGRCEVLGQAVEELVDLAFVVSLERAAEFDLLDVEGREASGPRGTRGLLPGGRALVDIARFRLPLLRMTFPLGRDSTA